MNNSAKPLQIAPENAGNCNSEALKLKIFRGSMPPDPPRGTAFGGRLTEPLFMKSWIRPRKYLLKMLEMAFARLYTSKFSWHPLRNLLRIDKESQFVAMSNIKFILLQRTPLGASAAPRPLACVGAFSPTSRLLSKYHRLLQILLTALSSHVHASERRI